MIYTPVVSLIGRQNVGKSTLFNKLTRTNDALVYDQFGVTRDRKYGIVKWKNYNFIIIDTVGIVGNIKKDQGMFSQSIEAIKESDLLLFIVDGRNGLLKEDQNIVNFLRKYNKDIFIIINKTEKINNCFIISNFYYFGIKKIIPISALYRKGINFLVKEIFSLLINNTSLIREKIDTKFTLTNEILIFKNKNISYKEKVAIKIAIVGSPNVGKSTLTNCVVGRKRMTVSDKPGTTLDSVSIPTYYNNNPYILIDTSGIRRKNKFTQLVEKFSVLKSLNAINYADVTLLLFDAKKRISDQDLYIVNRILKNGKSLVIAINKCESMSERQLVEIKNDIRNRITNILIFVRIHFISALNKNGIKELFNSIDEAYKNSTTKISVSKLNNIMSKATFKCKPPLINKNKSVKLKYVYISNYNPLTIVINGDRVNQIPLSYKKYLIKYFYKSLKIKGSIIRLILKDR